MANSLAACTASGALAAMRRAYSMAVGSNWSMGTTLLTRPQRSAVAALKLSPVSKISMPMA